MDPRIRRLSAADGQEYLTLRREMLLDTPLAFGSSPEDDFCRDEGWFEGFLAAGPGNVLYGAFDPDLVGAVGLFRGTGRKAAHLVTLWGMYVKPHRRRRGLGGGLVSAAIDHARTVPGVRQIHLGVSDATPGARAVYESLGFVLWGTEPRATCHQGRFTDEHHMVLRLDASE